MNTSNTTRLIRERLQTIIDAIKKFVLPQENYLRLNSKDLKYVFPTTLINVTYYGSMDSTIYFKSVNREVSRFIEDFNQKKSFLKFEKAVKTFSWSDSKPLVEQPNKKCMKRV